MPSECRGIWLQLVASCTSLGIKYLSADACVGEAAFEGAALPASRPAQRFTPSEAAAARPAVVPGPGHSASR